MLTLTLRRLERDGMVKRTAFPTVPVGVDYELTPLGRSLSGPISVMAARTTTPSSQSRCAQTRFTTARAAQCERSSVRC
jgi:DNA-binding HxlR family transcriptional regulator